MIVLLDTNSATFISKGKVRKEEIRKVIDKELLKGKRVVWLRDQRVLYGKSRDVKSFLQSEKVYSEPAYYAELIGEEEKVKEFNLYLINGKDAGVFLYQKPTCLVPLLFILKKEGEKKFGKEKFIFGYYSSGEAVLVSCEDGRIRRSRTEKASRTEVLEQLKKSGIENLFIAGITLTDEELYELLLKTSYLKREYTPLNDVLKEIFLEEEETVKLLKSIKAGGVMLALSSLLYLGTSVYSYSLDKEVSSLSRDVGILKSRLEKLKQKKLFPYVNRKSLHPEKVKLPLSEVFLDKLTEREIVYQIPREVFTSKEETALLERVKKKCKLSSRSLKSLTLKCRVKPSPHVSRGEK